MGSNPTGTTYIYIIYIDWPSSNLKHKDSERIERSSVKREGPGSSPGVGAST